MSQYNNMNQSYCKYFFQTNFNQKDRCLATIKDTGSQYIATSENNENFIYKIFDSKDFNSVEDQVIVKFRDTGIPEDFLDFSITLNFISKKKESKRKENMNIFQTGQTHKKNLMVSITPQNTIKVTFRQGKEQEFLYSQTKIKPNISYDLCIVYEVIREQEDSFIYNITLYLNGKNETNLSLNSEIARPSGLFYFGSESALGTFVGEISHGYFVTRNLSEGEIVSLHQEKKLNPMDPKNPHAILEEAQQSQFGGGFQDIQAQRRNVPAALQRTHITLLQNHISGQSQMVVLDNKSIRSMNKQQFEQAELNAVFSRDPYLEQQCRSLSYHFKWMMCTLQQLSPAIEEIGKSGLPFTCLSSFIASGRISAKLPVPIYIIEFKRFMKVLKYAEIIIPEEQVLQIANITKTYYEFKTDDPDFEEFSSQFKKNYGCVHQNLKKQSEEDNFMFKGLVYDKLLIAIRDTVLLPEEVDNVRREYQDQNFQGVVDEINMDEATPANHVNNQTRNIALNTSSDQANLPETDEETRQRQELANQLYQEKLKILNCQPLFQYEAGQTVTYNSYHALLNLLEIQKKDISEASLYVFKGIFLQRTYVSANIKYPNILTMHQKFFQVIGSKGNIFTQMEIIFKNMCASGQEEVDFNTFFAYWSKHVSGNDSKTDVQQIFEDIQITKNGFLTIKDLYYYFHNFEIMFVYQKRETDTHIMIGLYNNSALDSIIHTEICPHNYPIIKSLSFTSKRHPKTDQKYFLLQSLKQNYKSDKNEYVELKAFEDYQPEQTVQYELQDLSFSPTQPQESYGIEITVNLQTNDEMFGNRRIEYLLLSVKALYKSDAEHSQQIVKEMNNKHKLLLGPISAPMQAEPGSPTNSPKGVSDFGPDQIDDREQLPVPDPIWNQGKFIINVNRCTQCETHTTTTWHDEVDFIEKFNHFGDCMKQCFPNCEVIGNHDKPNMHYENFDVYIRGVGPESERDQQGRIWLYSKKEGIFSFLYYFTLRILKAYDKLVLLCSGYGNTVEMEKVQEYYLTRFESMISQKWSESHAYPCDVPKRKVEIQREIEEENTIKEGTKMICKNWGCGKAYDYSTDVMNTKHACLHHPGSYQLGSIHALWPESWTCCRGEWDRPGCRRGPHKGVVEKKMMFLCINVGEINPKTKRPDSACGLLYNDDFPSDCVVHGGYFRRTKGDEGEWTCCQDGNPNSGGCSKFPQHNDAKWPDVEAKKYFIEKQIINPGLISFSGKKMPVINLDAVEPYKKAALKAGVYRDNLNYTPFVNQVKRQQNERKENENEVRICTRYGCFKKIDGRNQHHIEFTDVDNEKCKERRKKNCHYHTGTYDFGHTGVTNVSQATTDTLWGPHWTCCRTDWTNRGCEKGYHDGPLKSKFVEKLTNQAKETLKQYKDVDDKFKEQKYQTDLILERFKNENEQQAELQKLPFVYNEQEHQQIQTIIFTYANLIDTSKKEPRVLFNFYEKEYWPNNRAQKNFWKQISELWEKKLNGYQIGERLVKGLRVEEIDIRNLWFQLFKNEERVSISKLSKLCDKLNLHLFAVNYRLDFHFKFWDIVNRDLGWFTNGSDTISKEEFIQWWFMETAEYLELKESYKEGHKQQVPKKF